MDEPARRLGRAIEAAREKAGLTQTQLASKLGKHQTTVSSWEAGRASPKSISDLLRLEDALGLTRGALFVRAGYVELTGSLEEAIYGSPDLDEAGRQDLLILLDHVLSREEGRPRRRRF